MVIIMIVSDVVSILEPGWALKPAALGWSLQTRVRHACADDRSMQPQNNEGVLDNLNLLNKDP